MLGCRGHGHEPVANCQGGKRVTAREERDAAMRRHPSAVREWQDWADGLTPDDHPIPDAWALVMILFLGVVVPWVIVIAAVRWAVR